jgi:hypothetical protein
MKRLSYFVFIVLLACQSEQDKFVQAEFDKIAGHWVVSALSSNAQMSIEVKNALSKSEFLFRHCMYSKKSFDNNTACGGDYQAGDDIYFLSHKYNYDTKTYPLDVYPVNSNAANAKPVPPSSLELKIMELVNGDWDFVITDNQMTAKQVTNKSGLSVQLIFTATKK